MLGRVRHDMTSFGEADRFVPVKLRSLQHDSIVPVNLHIVVHGRHVLYRSRDLPFDTTTQANLRDNGVSTLWVAAADTEQLHAYFERILAGILDDAATPTVQRARAVVDVMASMARELLRDPKPDKARRALRTMRQLASFVVTAPGAVPQLIQLLGKGSRLETHSVNTAILAAAMASQVPQQSLDAVAGVAAAGLLHDIGLRAVPAGVLRKPGRLSDGEWVHVRKHPLRGEEILRAVGAVPPDVLGAVRWHHERLDGSGYPDALPADAIPWSARAVAIAEVFDSLTSDQPYRARMTPYRALRLMLDEMTAGLDTPMIRGFVPQLLQETWMADFQRGLAAPLRPVAAV